jgi:protein-L-isoaspartate(D-aspartate) O-methyltransferase
LDFEANRRLLVQNLKQQGVIVSESVERAMLAIPREEFVWPDSKEKAYQDSPLPIGDTGQTLSAPHMVALMLEELKILPGQRVLEVGTGSGYNAALLAEMVGGSGHVVSVELLGGLVEFSTSNLGRLGYLRNVQVVQGDGSLGYPPNSSEELYDRVVVTAACRSVPKILTVQLKRGGVLLVPVGGPFSQMLLKLEKDMSGRITERALTWVSFVPLRGGGG